MPCCGPKLSLFCTLISIWGVIMLPILGLLLNFHSTAFAEDFAEVETGKEFQSADELWNAVKTKYETAVSKFCSFTIRLYTLVNLLLITLFCCFHCRL